MKRDIGIFPRVAIFLVGVAAGALTNRRRDLPGADAGASEDLRKSLDALGDRVAANEAATAQKFEQIGVRLEEHSVKLAEMPSTAQIVGAMEQLLSRTMASLDERLTNQAHSIDVLKTTVGQTDSLLERVLESLDSLQSFTDPADLAEDPLLHRPAV
jgi:hypothetical protein